MNPSLPQAIAFQHLDFPQIGRLSLIIAVVCCVQPEPLYAIDAVSRPVQRVQVSRDIVYASPDDVELTCDIYRTENTSAPSSPNRRPAILVIHGGAWSSGSKRMVANHATLLAQAGAVVMAIDYRHAPTYKFPAQVDDVRDALVWLVDHADQWQIDVDRIGIFGYSAGGHLACMIATLADETPERVLTTSQWDAADPRWKRLPKVKAVVAGGPPCEFTTLPPGNTGLEFFLGGSRAEKPEVYVAASPTSFASQGDCPVCFIHGDRDFIVPIASSRSLYDAQLACDVKSEFVVVEKQGHLVTYLHPRTSEALREYMTRELGLTP